MTLSIESQDGLWTFYSRTGEPMTAPMSTEEALNALRESQTAEASWKKFCEFRRRTQ